MEQEPLYISLSPEAEALLTDNKIDLVDELTKRGLHVSKAYGTTLAEGNNQTKEVALVILASAAAFGIVSAGIAHILTVLANKPVIVKNRKSTPVRKESGEIEVNKDGRPIMQEEETETLVTPDTPLDSGIKAELGQVFRFEFTTGKGSTK